MFSGTSLNAHLLADGSPKDLPQQVLPSMEKIGLSKHKIVESLKLGDVPTDMSDTSDTNEPEGLPFKSS